jgi:excisionase family DNA binding protein
MAVLATLSVVEAAKTAGVSRDTIYSAIRDGRLTALDCCGKWRILKTDAEAFVRNSRGRPRLTEGTQRRSDCIMDKLMRHCREQTISRINEPKLPRRPMCRCPAGVCELQEHQHNETQEKEVTKTAKALSEQERAQGRTL